jgi:hypothetical protein
VDIISNCFLCDVHSLHVVGSDDEKVSQCLNCGYVTSPKYKGTIEDNESYKKLSKEMRGWAVEVDNQIWIPTMITLPFGTLYPENRDDEIKWVFAEMVDIPEEEQKNYPKEDGSGFYEKTYDTDNGKVFDLFLEAMVEVNETAKNLSKLDKKGNVKLPKLKLSK